MSRLALWSPFAKTERGIVPAWSDMMERYFPPAMLDTNGEDRWIPRTDVKETPEAFLFTSEAPGLKVEDINVNLVGDTLTISGEKKKEEKKDKDNWHVTERSYGAFTRSFTFPTPVEMDNVEAEMKDGILTVRVLKSKKTLPKKVTIHVAK